MTPSRVRLIEADMAERPLTLSRMRLNKAEMGLFRYRHLAPVPLVLPGLERWNRLLRQVPMQQPSGPPAAEIGMSISTSSTQATEVEGSGRREWENRPQVGAF